MPRPLSTPPHYSLPYLPSNPKARTPRMLSPHTFFGGIQHCSLRCGLGISVSLSLSLCVCVCVCVCACVCVCVCVCVCMCVVVVVVVVVVHGWSRVYGDALCQAE